MADTEVKIYYGPPSWFHKQIGTDLKSKNLVTLVLREDARRREFRVVVPEQESEPVKKVARPKHVVAGSSDYASLNEHVITNFAQLVRSMRPKHLYLNNPPSRVHDQLERAFADTTTAHYVYPPFTTETLRTFRDEFGNHLVGQESVRETLLAAMYPLARLSRGRPVVLMFYGPSGVGKTQTAQFINGLLGGELLRKQFSMFHSEKFASYMFGGEHGEASLARDLLDRESGVILIDEFDKANPIFHSAFYELFDTGEFVDKNYTVQVGPALIICTSNYSSKEEIRDALGDALASRFDALIEFQHLTSSEVLTVIERTVDSRLAGLSAVEQLHVTREQLLGLLGPLAASSHNIRELGKTIDSVISILLVRSALEADTDLDPPTATAEGR
ncbi:AAA family ATPase [Nocardioides sp. J2M5]|uniref:AAA family ATPase n=1 Tax=Nocardioides palaemonis TaxID=2829810 RepID=UPI001BAB777B|nr:AAA family ATPase [Nocardioides palaemonis]MBS2937718.1 AAA family ATPase [Nocardioides palaemonis]